ncbi:MAG: sensor histidine kinase, partial [Rhodospirillaceae bacterium]
GRRPDDGGLFAQCTDTIIRHVGDIGHMVDEFSAFARLPAAILRPTEMGMVIRESVVLQRTAYPNIKFTLDLPAPVRLKCDVRQVGQALTNVLKNAVEAIEARFGPAVIGKTSLGAVTIHLETTPSEILVRVTDNGTGLPQSSRERLTEPYVTTRAKGTGLGLAIVKKIMEDHGGNLSLEDAPADETASDKSVRVGAQVTLHFPITLAIDAETSAPAPIHAAIAGE